MKNNERPCDGGFIVIPRLSKLKPQEWLLYAHLFRVAAFMPHEREIAGNTISVEKGEMVVTLRKIGKDINWNDSKVWRVLTSLKEQSLIEKRRERHGSLNLLRLRIADYEHLVHLRNYRKGQEK